MISFFVSGFPRGQPRPRAFAFNGKARVYDPGTAEGWKSSVAISARPHIPTTPISEPVSLEVTFLMPRPKKHFKGLELRKDAPCFFAKKPDSDNLAKAVMDALTSLRMWTDDALVCDLSSKKRYSNNGTTGAQVNISLLTPYEPMSEDPNIELICPNCGCRIREHYSEYFKRMLYCCEYEECRIAFTFEEVIKKRHRRNNVED